MWIVKLRRLLKTAGRDLLVLWHACRDPATPASLRWMAVAFAAYLISPIDLIPDFLGLFGVADDLALLMLGIPFLLRRVPADAMARATVKADATLRRWGFGGGARAAASGFGSAAGGAASGFGGAARDAAGTARPRDAARPAAWEDVTPRREWREPPQAGGGASGGASGAAGGASGRASGGASATSAGGPAGASADAPDWSANSPRGAGASGAGPRGNPL